MCVSVWTCIVCRVWYVYLVSYDYDELLLLVDGEDERPGRRIRVLTS